MVALTARVRAEGLQGWTRGSEGRLEPVQTVAGCIARGVVIAGRCSKHDDCSRRVRVDLRFWAAHGFELMAWSDLAQQFKCGRLGGCALDLKAEYPGGVPLVALAEKPDHWVEFFCQACRRCGYKDLASRLLAGMRRRGRPEAETAGIVTVARMLRLSCPCRPHRHATWYARAEEVGRGKAPGT